MQSAGPQPLRREERVFTSSLDELTPMRDFVRSMCEGTAADQLPMAWKYRLELAVNEAASNVMRHAFGGDPSQPIRMQAEVFVEAIVLRIIHRGKTFDPSQVAAPSFDGSRDGGFGVFLIAHAVDEVDYQHDGSGENCIFLRKRFEHEP